MELLNTIIKTYHCNVHPYTILKVFEVLLFRLQEEEMMQYIDELIFAATKLYGLQIILFFLQKYICEEFI